MGNECSIYSAMLSPDAILGRGRYPLLFEADRTGPRSSRGLLALGVTGRSCGLESPGTSLRIELAGSSCCAASAEARVGDEPGEREGTLPGSECVFRLPRLVVLSELTATAAFSREAALATVVLAAWWAAWAAWIWPARERTLLPRESALDLRRRPSTRPQSSSASAKRSSTVLESAATADPARAERRPLPLVWPLWDVWALRISMPPEGAVFVLVASEGAELALGVVRFPLGLDSPEETPAAASLTNGDGRGR